jgi:glycerophosphoryl diester phosphodiesterase
VFIEVQLSSDGVPIVISGGTLSRTTSGRGRVREKQANTLLQLDAGSWFNHRFPSRARQHYASAPIPLLFEVLYWVREQKCMALVAIKNPQPEAEVKVLKEIDRAKVHDLTRVIAYNLPGLRRLRQLDRKVHIGLSIAGRLPAIREAKALGAEVLLPHWKAASPSFIYRAHRASMLVIPWTVDSPRQMRRTILEGVDGIITNYPAKLTETVARLSKAARAATAKRIASYGSGRAALSNSLHGLGLVRNPGPTPPPLRPSTIKEML